MLSLQDILYIFHPNVCSHGQMRSEAAPLPLVVAVLQKTSPKSKHAALLWRTNSEKDVNQ